MIQTLKIAIIFGIWLYGQSTVAASCPEIFSNLYSGRYLNKKYWEPSNFSDPRSHNPNKFQYIAHGISFLPSHQGQTKAFLPVSAAGAEALGLVNLWNDPTQIWKKRIFSASVINQDKSRTYGTTGLLLKVPEANVVATHYDDMGSAHLFKAVSPEELPKYKRSLRNRWKFKSPETILNKTKPGAYNEIILEGESDSGQKLEVVGLFVKTDNEGIPILNIPELIDAIESISKKYNLPVIYIKDENRPKKTVW